MGFLISKTPLEKIENLLNNNDFSIRQTFGHPFVDFKISHVGETFEKMMGDSSPLYLV